MNCTKYATAYDGRNGLSLLVYGAPMQYTLPGMKLTAQLKLNPSTAQADALRRTLVTANAAADVVSAYAFEQKVFRTYELHRALYYAIKAEYGLTAQMVVRTLAKVGDSYKTGDHHSKRTYKPHGSIAYDSRILSYNPGRSTVSIWTVGGRQTVPFVAGERQRRLLEHRRGESDLVCRNGQFYLLATCDVDAPDPIDVDVALGIDLGVTNIVVDSDGETTAAARSTTYATATGDLGASCNAKARMALGGVCARWRDRNAGLLPTPTM